MILRIPVVFVYSVTCVYLTLLSITDDVNCSETNSRHSSVRQVLCSHEFVFYIKTTCLIVRFFLYYY